LFNDRPVHGKDFLVSVSGDRQVLTIPEVGDAHIGTVSCVAENAAGRAICSAEVQIGEFDTLALRVFLFPTVLLTMPLSKLSRFLFLRLFLQ